MCDGSVLRQLAVDVFAHLFADCELGTLVFGGLDCQVLDVDGEATVFDLGSG